MLVPLLGYWFMQGALVVVCVVSASIVVLRRVLRPPMPVARIGPPSRRFVGRVAPVLALVGALAGMWQLHQHATDVVVINPDMHGTRAVYLGDRDYYAQLPRRDDFDDRLPRNPTWIVNASQRTVQVVKVYYGPGKGAPIGPGELGVAPSVDYLGPGEQPPPGGAHDSTLFSRNKDAYVTWVTW